MKSDIEQLLKRYAEGMFPSFEAVARALSSGKQKIYLGVDPTGPDIHLGHATNLLVMRRLQQLGHHMIFLIGDFTAMIGDPSGRDSSRKVLNADEVQRNMVSYIIQVEKILPKGSFEIQYNSEWFSKMPASELIQLGDHFTVQQMIGRDMFQARIKNKQPISIREFLYPLLQGYDSVAMDVDGELCGNDQTFNALAGRDLLKILKKKEKFVLATKLLIDPTTNKKIMSKSEGRYISLNDTPHDMFGKVMSLPDHMIVTLYTLCTEAPMEIVDTAHERMKNGENPKTIKEELAYEIVRLYHGEASARSAQKEFENVFLKGEQPEGMQEFKADNPMTIADALIGSKLVASKSEVARLIKQGAVRINGEIVDTIHHEAKPRDIIKVGPRRFLKIL